MNLLVITDLSFPTGSAMSSRIKSFCMLFKELGYDIHIIAAKSDNEVEYKKIYQEDNFTYEIVKSHRSEQIQSFIGNENLVKRVDEYLSCNKIDLVFFNSLGALFNKILAVCKKYNVKTLLEQCEWYDASSFRFNTLDYRYINFNNNLHNNFKKVNGIVSISSLLNDYYLSIGAKTIRIPSIFDVKNGDYKDNASNNKIKLIYTGSVGKSKELLKPIIETITSDENYINNIELDIYGLDKNAVLNNIDNQNGLLKENVIIHGRVPYAELKEALKNANYQIFIKPERRSANAQFPTKLAESMSFGTPVITNNTGDICLYLKDGVNGFVCDKDNIKMTIDKIMSINNNDYNELRKKARETALRYFDYRNYIEDMKGFVEKL